MSSIKTFCIAPWTHGTVHTDLTYKPCCYSFPKEKFTDKKEWWNSQYMQELRKSLWKGERHSDCTRCWKEEDSGGVSLRQNYNTLFNKYADFNQIKQSANNNFIVDQDPITWDLRIGNMCNLKCVMCNGEYSSKIAQEDLEQHDKIIELFPNKQSYSDTSIVNWDNTKQGSKLLTSIEKNARWVKLQGGEPLAVKSVRDFIRNLHKDTILNITTNGTVLDTQLLKSLSQLKQVDFGISLEAASNANNIIRYGSDWYRIKENIFKINELKNTNVQINHVLQITSVFYLKEVIEFAEENKLHLNLGILNDPNYLSLNACPTKYLEQLVKDIDALSIQHPKNQYIKKYIKESINNATFNQNLWQDFKKYVKLLDTIRTEKYSSVLNFHGETYE